MKKSTISYACFIERKSLELQYMKHLRKLFVVYLMTKVLLPLASQGYSSQQLVPAGHWVYDSLNALCLETKFLSIADNAPLSVKEIKFYLSCIDYDALSYGGKQLYDKTLEYLNEQKFAINLKPVRIGVNLELNPTVLARTNDQIKWSISTDYTAALPSGLSGYTLTEDKWRQNNDNKTIGIPDSYYAENELSDGELMKDGYVS